MNSVKSLIRADLGSSNGYIGVKPLESLIEEIGIDSKMISKLDANENPYGPLPEVFAAIENCRIHEYPDPDQTFLRQSLSLHLKVPIEKICCGCGSDDLIDLIIRIIKPGPIVTCSPTFGMYKFSAAVCAMPFVDVPRLEDFTLNFPVLLETIEEKKASIIFLASPNNPTGNNVPIEQVETLCKISYLIVVIDEAYVEFNSESSFIHLLDKYRNLIILRTFSKWAALAGIRCGYVLADPCVISMLFLIKQPYNVNVAAQSAARIILENSGKVLESVNKLKMEKLVMMNRLLEFDFLRPLPSEGNFFLAKVVSKFTARQLWLGYRRLGILTRYFSYKPLDNYIRFSAGKAEDTQRLISATKLINSSEIFTWSPNIYNAILFDMDGVIADESASYRRTIISVCSLYGLELTLEDISKYKANGGFNDDYDASLDLIRRHSTHNPDRATITKQFDQFYRGTDAHPGFYQYETLIPSISLLKHLSSLVPLGIVTGRPKCDCERFLDAYGISKYFSVIICSEDAPHKPSPEPIKLALKNLGNPEKVFLIGDTYNDILAANLAGIDSFGILSPSEKNNESSRESLLKLKPSAFLEDLEELRFIFTKLF